MASTERPAREPALDTLYCNGQLAAVIANADQVRQAIAQEDLAVSELGLSCIMHAVSNVLVRVWAVQRRQEQLFGGVAVVNEDDIDREARRGTPKSKPRE